MEHRWACKYNFSQIFLTVSLTQKDLTSLTYCHRSPTHFHIKLYYNNVWFVFLRRLYFPSKMTIIVRNYWERSSTCIIAKDSFAFLNVIHKVSAGFYIFLWNSFTNNSMIQQTCAVFFHEQGNISIWRLDILNLSIN